MKGVTPYQLEILEHVRAGTPAEPVDFDQLLEALSWKPTKASAQFTIRACITKGLMEKTGLQLRRGRKRVCYALTKAGKEVFDPRKPIVPEPIHVEELTGEEVLEPTIFDPGFISE